MTLSDKFNITVFGLFAATALGLGGVQIAYVAQENQTSTITVESRERGREKQPDLVYTPAGTYKVDDSWTRGQFRTADLYGMMREGCTYNVTHYGFRNGFLSKFPNIVAAEHVPTATCPTNGGMPTRFPRR